MRSGEEIAIGTASIRLMRGAVYRDSDEDTWIALERHLGAVRDHFRAIGVDVVVDDAEGYAFLRSTDADSVDSELPRLVRRRTLTYPVSVLLVLLRKRLAQFESDGGDGRLVLTTEQIVEMMRLFLPETSHEARTADHVESTIKKVVELGFLRSLRTQRDHWEVRRLIKAYVDAQTLGDFAARLDAYAASGSGPRPEPEAGR